ncbi:hypothetical protein P376_1735 [Streptomyces sp. HCCB10043]|nr:hypothetical protein P376_1735 [Streptomyces sp. HCCB10043]
MDVQQPAQHVAGGLHRQAGLDRTAPVDVELVVIGLQPAQRAADRGLAPGGGPTPGGGPVEPDGDSIPGALRGRGGHGCLPVCRRSQAVGGSVTVDRLFGLRYMPGAGIGHGRAVAARGSTVTARAEVVRPEVA